jgi:hypothetical protein
MAKGAGPPTGYVSPETQAAGGGHYEGGFGAAQKGQWVPDQPGVFQQSAEATAQANRPTQNTPFGSMSWKRDPATGAWTQNVGFSGALGGASDAMQQQALANWGVPLDNGATARTNAENAIYGRETSRLDPQWQQREQSMNASLANQGLDPGSAAATSTRDQFGRARNDAYQQATYGSIIGGGQEAQRQQGMDLQARMAPLSGLQSLQQLLHMPGFQPGPNYLAATQAASNYNLQNAEQQNQMLADYFKGLAGLGVAGVGAM